jgi:hypothetical protein
MTGTPLLNLQPTPQRLGDHYLKTVFRDRFGSFTVKQRRPRPDVADLAKSRMLQIFGPASLSFALTSEEILLTIRHGGQERVVSLLSTAMADGNYVLGFCPNWTGGISLYVCPDHLTDRAEAVRARMAASFTPAQRLFDIGQQDAATIAAISQSMINQQWRWFDGQQAAHLARSAIGDAIIGNYWSRDAAISATFDDQPRNQSVNDRLSQERSDAMMGRQNLVDVTAGKSYSVAADSNYYWVNPSTGTVVGTNTGEPPDNMNPYSALKKV